MIAPGSLDMIIHTLSPHQLVLVPAGGSAPAMTPSLRTDRRPTARCASAAAKPPSIRPWAATPFPTRSSCELRLPAAGRGLSAGVLLHA